MQLVQVMHLVEMTLQLLDLLLMVGEEVDIMKILVYRLLVLMEALVVAVLITVEVMDLA